MHGDTNIKLFLSSSSRVLPGKLRCSHLVKRFPSFQGTRRFVPVFTTAFHSSLYWARCIQPTVSTRSTFTASHVSRLRNSIQQSPSWEAASSSASQEIPRILWNPMVNYRKSQVPATCPYSTPDQSSPHVPFPLFEDPFLILPSHPRLGLPSNWSFRGQNSRK